MYGLKQSLHAPTTGLEQGNDAKHRLGLWPWTTHLPCFHFIHLQHQVKGVVGCSTQQQMAGCVGLWLWSLSQKLTRMVLIMLLLAGVLPSP
jgi:hypothetical protein